MYLTDSMKQYTRDRRTHHGTTQRQRVIAGAPIPAKWEAFLRSNAYKDKLFHYNYVRMRTCLRNWQKGDIISTNDETIISNQNDMSDVEYIRPCSHEEADKRILSHVAHCARQGLRKVEIRTVDTHVVVLAIGHFPPRRLD